MNLEKINAYSLLEHKKLIYIIDNKMPLLPKTKATENIHNILYSSNYLIYSKIYDWKQFIMLKHILNYLSVTIFSVMLGVVSIPVLTHLLQPSEYGAYTNFYGFLWHCKRCYDFKLSYQYREILVWKRCRCFRIYKHIYFGCIVVAALSTSCIQVILCKPYWG